MSDRNIAEDLIANLLTVEVGKEEIAVALQENDITAYPEDPLSNFPDYISQLSDYTLSEIEITENNQTYTAGEREAYIKAHVQITFEDAPTTWPKYIDQNGTYEVENPDQGWTPIEVNIQDNNSFELYISDFEPGYNLMTDSNAVIISDFEPACTKTYSAQDILIGKVEIQS